MLEFAEPLLNLIGGKILTAPVEVLSQDAWRDFHGLHMGNAIKNHDVVNALYRSYRTTIRVLEDRYDDSDKNLASTRRAFARLQDYADELFPKKGNPPPGLGVEFTAVDPPDVTEELVNLVAVRSPRLRKFLQEHFQDCFVFCFKEIGLKGNERVRAVIQTQLLTSIQKLAEGSARDLSEMRERLADPVATLEQQLELQRFQRVFASAIHGRFDQLSSSVDKMIGLQERLQALLEEAEDTDKRVLAYAVVFDRTGKRLVTQPLFESEFSVGRQQAGLILPDPQVSRDHARVTLGSDHALIRDQGSGNGTWVAGERVETAVINFGDTIKFGEVSVQFLLPSADLPEAAATEPSRGQ